MTRLIRFHFAFLAILSFGCGDPVREDRTIEFSRDGDAVAFQHDREGVFVADAQGSNLTRIFEPDPSVVATSRPLHNPRDGRLIFTTARDLGQQGQPQAAGFFDTPPEGAILIGRPVKYTCWLRDEPVGDSQPSPRELFTARCEHIGYVGAGLAVRWHPDGERLLYVDSRGDAARRHAVYEFNVRDGSTRRAFPHRADAVIFDFTPVGSRLVCLVGNSVETKGIGAAAEITGIWIGTPADDASWRHVSGSQNLAHGELPSLIESLRASRPAWTADESRFASVVSEAHWHGEEPARSMLRITRGDTHGTKTVFTSAAPLTDLHWSPDGSRLGFVEQSPSGGGNLRIYAAGGDISAPVNSRPVRRFAGFDSSGTRLAYVVADESGLSSESQNWSLLLSPDRLSRDAVVVANAADGANAASVFSGMRVTFPLWSPTENRLSVWMTFVPRYRSLLSLLRGLGLRPGDPAATLDLGTGEVSWLAVNPAEELQVGHCYLLKKDWERAWEWYERANAKRPPPKPPRDWAEFVQTLGAPDRSELFEYHCLTQLGRLDAARARLNDFERNFFPPGPKFGEPAAEVLDQIRRQFGSQFSLLLRVVHDLYAAEVFLSVDAPDAGIAFFREQMQLDDDPVNRLSRALALSQLALIAERREEYLSTCTELIAPFMIAAKEPAGDKTAQGDEGDQLVKFVAGLGLGPLFREEFLAGIPEETVRAAIERCEKQSAAIDDDFSTLLSDLFLRAAHLRLGEAALASEIEERIANNPLAKDALAKNTIDEVIEETFTTVRQMVR